MSHKQLSPDFENGFVDLLVAAFRDDQAIRNFVAQLRAGGQVTIRLPGSGASTLAVAQSTVRLLDELGDLEEALAAVGEEREHLQAPIAELRKLPRHVSSDAPARKFLSWAPPLPRAHVERANLAALCDTVMAKPSRLVGITGALGVGKTTFAAAMALSSQAQKAFSRICWLAPDEHGDNVVLTLQAQLFGQLGGGGNFREVHWRGGLATLTEQASKVLDPGQRLLVVVDDPPAPVDTVITALQVHPDTTVLVSSENRAALKALGADPLVDLGPMSPEESLAVLAQCCQCAAQDLPDAAREIAFATGGLPLALVIIGDMVSLAGDREAEWVALRDDLRAGRVEHLEIPGLENANVLAAFQRGLGALNQKELDDLHVLATLPPDSAASVKTLQALWSTGDDNEARRRADRLAMRSLLRHRGSAGYALHKLLRLALRALDGRLDERFQDMAVRLYPSTPRLMLALSWRDRQVFAALVATADNEEVNRATPQGVTALQQAALLGMADAVGMLLERGADPRHENENGFCALQAAAQGGDVATIRLLLDHSASPARKNPGGKTALDIAARFGHAEAVRVLSSNARAVEASGYALAIAAKEGHDDVVTLLLAAGADPNVAEGISPALSWASHKGRAKIAAQLLAAGAHVDQVADEQTALFAAATDGHGEVVELLIAAQADVAWKTPKNRTVLHQAAQSGDPGIVQQLISAGAPVGAVDAGGLTPLHISASLGHVAVIDMLAHQGAQLDLLDGDGWTALHRAIHERYPDAVKALLSVGADPGIAGRNGITPLAMAVISASPGIQQKSRMRMDEKGTHLEAVTAYTPIGSSTLHMIRLLIAAGADINAADEKGQTALHLAVAKNSPELISLLLELGADRGKRNEAGQIPWDVAEAAGPAAAQQGPLMKLRIHAVASLLRQ
ncbi:MAG: ankyrin repeat domain-containing protein [Parvibaculaceae bacterium]